MTSINNTGGRYTPLPCKIKKLSLHKEVSLYQAMKYLARMEEKGRESSEVLMVKS